MKNTIIIGGALVLIGAGVYFFTQNSAPAMSPIVENKKATTTETVTSKAIDKTKTVIGTTGEKRDIMAYHYGTGTKELLFVGGIHGGYEWNTALVAYELMDELAKNPSLVPTNVKVTVIPVLNPDGLNKVVGTAGRFMESNVSTVKETVIAGRFNANNVDLNRNFDCDWQTKGVWMNTPVSGGTKAFSEPESQAIKSYIEAHNPTAVVTWFSAAGGVFASSCHNGILPETKNIMNTYAKASGYKASDSYDFYATTGDMANWLAKKNIPAISVLLTTHQDTEWTKNLAGIKALLTYYGK